MTTSMTHSSDLWQRVVDSHQQYSRACSDFIKESPDKIGVLRRALRSRDRILALPMASSLTVEEKKALFAEWIDLARAAHSPFTIAWSIIESLPRDWVKANIEKEVDAILVNEDETDYWMFLQLYRRLDESLSINLTNRARTHPDPNIRELVTSESPGLPEDRATMISEALVT